MFQDLQTSSIDLPLDPVIQAVLTPDKMCKWTNWERLSQTEAGKRARVKNVKNAAHKKTIFTYN